MRHNSSEFIAALRAGRLTREHWKRFGAAKIAAQRDRLQERAIDAKLFALGGLQSVCWAAGVDSSRVYSLCDRRPELARYGR